MVKLFANSGDPHQTLHSVASDLGQHCLSITLLRVSRLKLVKMFQHFGYSPEVYWTQQALHNSGWPINQVHRALLVLDFRVDDLNFLVPAFICIWTLRFIWWFQFYYCNCIRFKLLEWLQKRLFDGKSCSVVWKHFGFLKKCDDPVF